jgi:uncharacterized protein YjbI with pentapeptide repeats
MVKTSDSLVKLDQAALDVIIAKHELFRQGRSGGSRALLRCHDLSQLVLRGCNLSNADFTGSLFYETDMAQAILDCCILFACDLRRANLRNASLVRADLRGVCLRGASLTGANLSDADLREGSFARFDPDKGISYVNEGGAWAEGVGGVDMRGATLASAKLSGAIATNSDFQDANLSFASFIRGDLSGANLSGANLVGADLSQCVLKNINMRGAVLTGTIIDYSTMVNVDMTGALTNAPAGKSLEKMPVPMKELIELHKLWLDTKGTDGQRLDLSNFDLRAMPLGSKEDLTMLLAEHSVWFKQDISNMNMQASQFAGSDMRNCSFANSDLRGSDFSRTNLIGSKFSRVNLEPLQLEASRLMKSNFTGAALRYTDFTNANLRDVNFTDADLSYSNFTGADLRGAVLKNVVAIDTRGLSSALDLYDSLNEEANSA